MAERADLGTRGGADGLVAGDDTLTRRMVRLQVFALEHRYYGESVPVEDYSTPNLQWLSSAQALADLASFVGAMRERHGLHSSYNRWVTFGGSYPGMLAAWARLEYPHLVHAAVSSSAPVHAVANFQVRVRIPQTDWLSRPALRVHAHGSSCAAEAAYGDGVDGGLKEGMRSEAESAREWCWLCTHGNASRSYRHQPIRGASFGKFSGQRARKRPAGSAGLSLVLRELPPAAAPLATRVRPGRMSCRRQLDLPGSLTGLELHSRLGRVSTGVQ